MTRPPAILNIDPVMKTQIDPRNMIASVGWVVEDGIADEPFDFGFMEDSFDDWMDCQSLEVFDFENFDENVEKVLEYAREMDASKKELTVLKHKLDKLFFDYPHNNYFLYSIESDLSIGVLPDER